MDDAVSTSPTLLEAVGDGGSVFDVLAIEAGTSRNRKRYRPEVLREAVPRFNGARAFASEGIDHDPAKRGVKSLVGWWDNARWFDGDHPATGKHTEGVAANFHVAKNAGWLRDLLSDALDSGKPDLVGFSIVGDGDWKVVREASGLVADVTRIDAIEAVDPVINPAAGGVALRLVASTETPSMDWTKLTLREAIVGLAKGEILADDLREHRKDLAEAIDAGSFADPAPAADPKPDAKPDTKLAESTDTPDVSQLVEAQVGPYLTQLRMQAKLAERANVPAHTRTRIIESVSGRALSEAEIDALIQREFDYAAALNPAVVKDAGARVTEMKGERDRITESVAKMLTGESNDSVKALYIDLTGDRGMTGRMQADGRLTESIQSDTFANILGDSITRAMLRDYAQLNLDTWRPIADVVPIRDFRNQERVQYGGYGNLPAVAERDPYPALSTPTDQKSTYRIAKKGGTEDVTLETIANDDLGAIRRIPQKLARAAAQTLHEFVWDMIRTNPTLSVDNVALFHASHANLGAAALDKTSLPAGRLAIKQQTDPDNGKRLGLVPRYLIVPQDLEQTAFELTQTDREVASNNNTLNFVRTFGLGVIVVDYWTDANNWYLAADKTQSPTIELGFFNGREEPELFLQDQPTVGSVFSNDKLTWKIRHIYGGSAARLPLGVRRDRRLVPTTFERAPRRCAGEPLP